MEKLEAIDRRSREESSLTAWLPEEDAREGPASVQGTNTKERVIPDISGRLQASAQPETNKHKLGSQNLLWDPASVALTR